MIGRPSETDTTAPAVVITDQRVLDAFDEANPDIGTLWELCVSLEWDRTATVEGIAAWLGPDTQRVLDCACGSGFPAIDLAQRGYRMTCSDGSPAMLMHFKRNAVRMGMDLEPVLARWEDLPGRFASVFDVVMCRGGGSLAYAGTWDDDATPDRLALERAIVQLAACIRPGGRLYIDATRSGDLERRKPVITRHPRYVIGGHIVELEESVTADRLRRLRYWRSQMRIDGQTYRFERRSHYLPHEELVRLMEKAGFADVRREDIPGESYDVFTSRKPGT